MVEKKLYGTWRSPLSAQALASSLRLNDVQWDSDGQTLVWSERRGKTGVLVMQRGIDAPRDITESNLSVGGRVGYGGGEFTVAHGNVYFVSGGRIYKQSLSGGGASPITPEYGGAASPAVSARGKWLAYVHTYENRDQLLLVDSAGDHLPSKLASGDDFVMQPHWHPDSTYIAYIAWNHPNMPWVGTELRLLHLRYDERGVPFPIKMDTLAGDANTAIFQPTFSPDGRYLVYASDASGWWQLYLYDLIEKTHTQITQHESEHAQPAWIQGMRNFAWTGDGSALVYLRNEKGFWSLHTYDVAHEASLKVADLDDYTYLQQVAVSPTEERIALVATASTIPTRIISYAAEDGVRIHQRSSSENLTADQLANAEAVQWVGHDGETAHGLYYPPTNPAYEGLGKPPLMVLVHGGPTSQRHAAYDAAAQFFATRGFAVLQVNHRGSTGYGRAYMEKHAGNWGVYDVQDSISGARHLIDEGLVDGEKIVIMGGSAGGYTVLQALVDAPGFFKAGVCSYGIGNQFNLLMDTHKFESHYSYWLLGDLPEAIQTWRDRSPLFQADRIQDALIVFQGTEDTVVPKNQSDAIVAAVRRKGIPHEYHVYEGEGHGWRKPETIHDFYEKTLAFLLQQVVYG